jgi:hypothetical protein
MGRGKGGADIRFIQEMLGHSKLASTHMYTKVSIRMLKQIHTANHPGARLDKKKPAPAPEPGAHLSHSAEAAATSYSGLCSTVTDPAGKTRTLCKDNLGPLEQFTEGGINAITAYGYDELDDLVSVN